MPSLWFRRPLVSSQDIIGPWLLSAISLLTACGDGEGDDGTNAGPTCGNQTVEPGEECDGTPFCTDCRADEGYTCRAPDNVCEPICGDGLVVGAECDSVTNVCSSDCFPCGDGKVGRPFECDDGNVADGDGCSSNCSPEAGYTCSGSPSTCAASGLAPDLEFGSLSLEQATTWCTWLLSLLEGPGAVVHCSDSTFTPDFYELTTVVECASNYMTGLGRENAWWCGNTKGGSSSYNLNCLASGNEASPLIGCNVGQAEKFLLRTYRNGEEGGDGNGPSVIDYGACELFSAFGTPSCAW